uniref:Protein-L-isoaspartate O-methyltransferase domain-containing protein 1 n=1 Tax=Schistosoma haematobium TaxID=6185 RepID=A0A094ZP91_SCHHA
MGGHVSRGRDNQSLIDELVQNGLTLNPETERALRLVDRGGYFSEKSPRAYMDMAWRSGSLHLSAPSIYIVALKNLDIQPGNCFLNVGSGTGYLSTVIGLLLGYNGVNHGIEVNDFNVNFSREHLVTFLSECDAPFERSFCPPVFLHGNILDLVVPSVQQPIMVERLNNFQQPSEMIQNNLDTHLDNSVINPEDIWTSEGNQNHSSDATMEVEGNDHGFMKIKRIEENKITASELMSVSFATLLPSRIGSEKQVESPPKANVISLEQQAARIIRSLLRNVIEFRHNGPPILGHMEEVEEEGDDEANTSCDTNEDSDTLMNNADIEELDGTSRDSGESVFKTRIHCSMARFLHYLINHAEIGHDRSQVSNQNSPTEDTNSNRTNSNDVQNDTTGDEALDAETGGSDGTATENHNSNPPYLRIDFCRFLNGVSNTIIGTSTGCEHSNEDEDTQINEIQNTSASVDNESTTDEHVKNKSTPHKKRKKYCWVPPSYTYKEEMERILSEELRFGKPLIRSVITL